MRTALEEAVDGLYAAFADRTRPKSIDYCTHCVGPGDVERLLAAAPLREIPADTLRFYTVDVLSTADSKADFRYFLPRILQLTVTGGFGGFPDLDLVMSKFVLGELRGWPASERRAVTAFLHALWSTTLTRAGSGAEELLGAIGRVEEDLGPYLRAWETALATHAGASQLLEFVRYAFGRSGTRYWLTVPGWLPSTVEPVRTWLGGLGGVVAATAETVTDEQTFDVLLELLASL
jgi:hypothetical protein